MEKSVFWLAELDNSILKCEQIMKSTSYLRTEAKKKGLRSVERKLKKVIAN